MYIEQYRNYTIHIGRNAEENDQLVANASPRSIWFHLHDQPSPHGVISYDENELPEKDAIQRCAYLVKKYSKAKYDPKVRVNYLPVSYVRLTNTAGLVELQRAPHNIRV
jgi:predicted ribosome quality control (RQC) complex YloA/Tae2 family protein